MQKGGATLLLSTTPLIGLNIKFYEIFASSLPINPLFSNQLPYNKILSESK